MAHVPCLSPEPALGCWYRKYSEDEDELLPLYHRSVTLKPRTEGSLRRRVLSAKIHQKQDSLWAPKPLAAPQLSCPHCFLSYHRPSCNPMHPHLERTECDKLRKDGFHNSHHFSRGPSLSTTNLSDCTTQDQEEDKKSSLLGCLTQSCLTVCCHFNPWNKKSAASSAEDSLEFSPRPQTLLEGNNDWLGRDEDVQMGWSRTLPLPTPEERMRQQALTFAAHIIPINITGETFDQQASARRSIVTTDTAVRQSKNITWRQTITEVPHDIQEELVVREQSKFHGHSMYVPSLCTVTSALCSSQTRDSSCQTEDERKGEEEEEKRKGKAEKEMMGEMEDERTDKAMVPHPMRRIRAHREQGMMANISAFSSDSVPTGIDCITEPRFHSMPSKGPHVSLETDPCYTISPCCPEDLPAGTLLCQMTQLHGVMIGAQESEREQAGNGWGSPHALPSTPLISNTLPAKAHSSSDRSLAMIGVTLNTPPPYHSSASSLSDNPSATDSQCITCSESDQSGTSSAITTDHWTYDTLPNSHLSSSCSSPVHHCSLGLPHSCSDGSFSPIGLRSHSYSSIGTGMVRHKMYQCHEHHSHSDRASLCSSLSLCRSISLRKAKTPPKPPTRTDSLRNFRPSLSEPQPGLSETKLDLSRPQLNLSEPHSSLIEMKLDLIEPHPGQSEPEPGLIETELDLSEPQLGLSDPQPGLIEAELDLSEPARSELKLSLSEPEACLSGTLIASLQLKSSGSWSPSLSDSHENPWVLRPQGQSNRVSASGCDSPNPATTSQSPIPAMPSQSPGSSLRSESQWRVPVTEVTTVTAVASNCSSMFLQQPQGISMLICPVMASSLGKEEPSSSSREYSSQSDVFTTGTPMVHHPRAQGRAKPRVPKRNSSLLCTALPSNPPPLHQPTLPTPPPVPHPSQHPSTPILLTALPSVPTSPLPPPLSEKSPPLQLKGLKDTCDADETISEQRPAPYQSLTPWITAHTLQMLQLWRVRKAPAVSLHREAGQQLFLEAEMADTSADSPAHTPTESPADPPTDSPADTPTDLPVDRPTDSPVHTRTDSPIDMPTNSPVDTPTDSPVDTPTDSPVDTPTDSPVDMPIKPEVPSVAALDSCPSPGESSAKTQTAQFFSSVVIAVVPLCSTNLSLMNNHSGSHQDLNAGVSAELCINVGGRGSPPQLDTELDSESRGSMLPGHSTEYLSSEHSFGSLEDLPELIIQEPELSPYPSRPNLNTSQDGSGETDQDEDGGGKIDGDGSSPSSGTEYISSKDEENGDVFEDMLENLLILTPPRTTEDLFAAIHRKGEMNVPQQAWRVLVQEEGSGPGEI